MSKLKEIIKKNREKYLKIKELNSILNLENIEDNVLGLNLEGLNNLRVKYLGKNGEITSLLKSLGSIPKEDRPEIGKLINDVKAEVENIIADAIEKIKILEKERKLNLEKIDISLPGIRNFVGHRHPLVSALNDMKEIFLSLGYTVEEGPEVELDYYNFEALNIPVTHPARGESDTFYLSDDLVLRTHTSPVQIRTMERQKPPIKIIAPGKVFRTDDLDPTHSPAFHQIEGLVVDKGITFSDLKGTLELVAKRMFGEDVKTKFRPHHFPFTEPSAEMDASCFVCKGKGCSVCKGSGWIELLGCGMVHPKVLENCNIDPEVYSGFAFGMGIDRIVMMKYGIDHVKHLYESDMRFLDQF